MNPLTILLLTDGVLLLVFLPILYYFIIYLKRFRVWLFNLYDSFLLVCVCVFALIFMIVSGVVYGSQFGTAMGLSLSFSIAQNACLLMALGVYVPNIWRLANRLSFVSLVSWEKKSVEVTRNNHSTTTIKEKRDRNNAIAVLSFFVAGYLLTFALNTCIAFRESQSGVETLWRIPGNYAFISLNYFFLILALHMAEIAEEKHVYKLCADVSRFAESSIRFESNKETNQAMGLIINDFLKNIEASVNAALLNIGSVNKISFFLYVLSVLVLICLSVLYQQFTGKITGWTESIAIVMSDLVILLYVPRGKKRPVTTTTTTTTTSNAQWENDDIVYRYRYLSIVLLVSRVVLISVPANLNFVGDCIMYTITCSFVCVSSIRSILRQYGGASTSWCTLLKRMKINIFIVTLLTVYITILTILVKFLPVESYESTINGLDDINKKNGNDTSSYSMDDSSNMFSFDQNYEINDQIVMSQWMIGLWAILFVICVNLITLALEVPSYLTVGFSIAGVAGFSLAVDFLLAWKSSGTPPRLVVFFSLTTLYLLCMITYGVWKQLHKTKFRLEKSLYSLPAMIFLVALLVLLWSLLTIFISLLHPIPVSVVGLLILFVWFAFFVIYVYVNTYVWLASLRLLVISAFSALFYFASVVVNVVGGNNKANDDASTTTMQALNFILIALPGWIFYIAMVYERSDGLWDHLVVGSLFCLGLIIASCFYLWVVFDSIAGVTALVVSVAVAMLISSVASVFRDTITPYYRGYRSIVLLVIVLFLLILGVIAAAAAAAAAAGVTDSNPFLGGYEKYFIASVVLIVALWFDYFFTVILARGNRECFYSTSPGLFGLPVLVYKIELGKLVGEMKVSNEIFFVFVFIFFVSNWFGMVMIFTLYSVNLGCAITSLGVMIFLLLAIDASLSRFRAFKVEVNRVQSSEMLKAALLATINKSIARCKRIAFQAIVDKGQENKYWDEADEKMRNVMKFQSLFLIVFRLITKKVFRKNSLLSSKGQRFSTSTTSMGAGNEDVLSLNDLKSGHSIIRKKTQNKNGHGNDSSTANPAAQTTATTTNVSRFFFMDKDFPACDESIYGATEEAAAGGGQKENYVLWKRVGDISLNACLLNNHDNNENPLPDLSEVQQGEIGDCWLLSALTVVASNADLFQKVFPYRENKIQPSSKPPGENGKYNVNLFNAKTGIWETVSIDDFLPVDDSTDQPMFAHSVSGNVFYMSLIEKAYAKINGGYAQLESKHIHHALVDFTGGYVELISLSEDVEFVESDALWLKLVHHYERNDLCCASSESLNEEKSHGDDVAVDGGAMESEATSRRTIPDHAYSILKVVSVRDYAGLHRCLLLRDPWGAKNSDLQNLFSEKEKWSTKQKRRFLHSSSNNNSNLEGDDSSCFWIDFDDFLNEFKWIYVCLLFRDPAAPLSLRKKSEWISKVVHGEWTTKSSTQFILSTAASVCDELFISITNTNEMEVFDDYPFMTLYALNVNGKKRSQFAPILRKQIVAYTGNFKNTRELSLRTKIYNNRPLTLVADFKHLSEDEEDVEGVARDKTEGEGKIQFRICVYSKYEVEVVTM